MSQNTPNFWGLWTARGFVQPCPSLTLHVSPRCAQRHIATWAQTPAGRRLVATVRLGASNPSELSLWNARAAHECSVLPLTGGLRVRWPRPLDPVGGCRIGLPGRHSLSSARSDHTRHRCRVLCGPQNFFSLNAHPILFPEAPPPPIRKRWRTCVFTKCDRGPAGG